jgi:hypothetical protein
LVTVFIYCSNSIPLTFLCTVRWCSMRVKTRRETRGASRSKCGDLTWAISIILTESTDASDSYDDFTVTEVSTELWANHWGWEYYYPKNIDLNYNLQQ